MSSKINRREFLIASAATTGLAPRMQTPGRHGAGQVRVVDLKVDRLDCPVGLENPCPNLSWRLESERRNVRQIAYRIRVSSSEEGLKAGNADLWDSGKVFTSRSFANRYSGLPLTSRKKCWWVVQIWDDREIASPPSEIARWEMGLLEPGDWMGKWLAVENRAGKENREAGLHWIWGEQTLGKGVRKFRFRFNLPVAAKCGELYAITNDWDMWTQITGVWIDDRVVAGSGRWRDASMEAESSVYDLMLAPLEAGDHLLCVEATTGDVLDVMRQCTLRYGLAVFVIFRLENDAMIRIETGPEWKTNLTEEPGWRDRSYDDTLWENARSVSLGGYQPLPPQPAMYLRNEFFVASQVSEARLYATALGAYEARINGNRVGDAMLTPEVSQYSKRVLYQVYDVTRALRGGSNALGFVVGDGWYASFDGRFAWAPAPLRVLAQLEVTYVDGSREIIATGPGWRTNESPIRRSEMKVGEIYDARLEQPGWDCPGFDDRSWSAAQVALPPACRLVAQVSQPIRVRNILEVRAISQPTPGVYVFDFGRNFAGWCRLHLKGLRGQKIELHFAEVLTPSGDIDQSYTITGVPKRDAFTLRGDPSGETLEPHFTYRGFRYVQVTGLRSRPTEETLEGVVIGSDLPCTGRLRVGAPIIEKIWHINLWTERSNLVGLQTDTPSREQRHWLSSAAILWDSISFDMDVCALASRYMEDIMDEQTADGAITMMAPEPHSNNAFFFQPGSAPGYGDAVVIIPWLTWRRYGDLSIAGRCWDSMNRYLDFILRHNPDYVWRNARGGDFMDWLGLDEITINSGYPKTPKDLIGTAYWANSARMLAQMADALGRENDAIRLRAVLERVINAFNHTFVGPNGIVGSGSQGGYVLALRFDLLGAEAKRTAAEHLAADVRNRGNMLTTGIMGTQFILDVLADGGYPDLAYALLLRTEFPSWGYMIRNGATTVWESWSGGRETQATLGSAQITKLAKNHAELASSSGFLFRRIAGIDAARPGFETIVVRPLFDARIKTGGGDYDSVMGRISTDWSQNINGSLALDVSVPGNALAQIHIPASPSARILESRRNILHHKDVRLIRRDNVEAIVEVGSGTYNFLVCDQ